VRKQRDLSAAANYRTEGQAQEGFHKQQAL
jgi:hypothetical protein